MFASLYNQLFYDTGTVCIELITFKRFNYHITIKCQTRFTTAICQKLVNMPSERFWVSEERASIVISDMLKGRSIENMNENKREMYEEIYRRVQELKKEYPNATVYELVSQVVEGPAPKFYLTPKSAKVIISKIKSEWYERRKQKYRHLFM